MCFNQQNCNLFTDSVTDEIVKSCNHGSFERSYNFNQPQTFPDIPLTQYPIRSVCKDAKYNIIQNSTASGYWVLIGILMVEIMIYMQIVSLFPNTVKCPQY